LTRVLALGCLVALFLAGRLAWAEDPAPTAPSAAPTKAPPKNVTTSAGTWTEGSTTAREIDADSVLRATPPGATERVLSPWSGSARLWYRLRTTDDPDSEWDTDQDLFAYLRLKYRDENLPGLSGSFHGRMTLDLDDFGNVDGFNVFDSIWDTYGERIDGRIYHAYLNYHFCRAPVSDVRLGRMWEDVGEFLTYDGVRVESARFGPKQIGVAALAGIPYYFYDDSSRSDDLIAGVQIFGNPWNGAEMEFDWTYIANDNVYGDVDNNLLNFEWNQRIGSTGLLRAQYQHLDEEARLVRVNVDKTWTGLDLVARGYFYTLLNYQAEMVYDLDAYYWVVRAFEPYWTANASVSKGIGSCFDVEGGFTIRRLYKAEDEGIYNREFEQYFLALGSYDWLVPGLSLTLSGEYWNSTDDIWTGIFDVEYRPSRRWRFLLGTDYSAYSYDIYADDERVNVYSVYGRIGFRPSPRWAFDLRLRVEDDDYGTYTTVDASAQVNF